MGCRNCKVITVEGPLVSTVTTWMNITSQTIALYSTDGQLVNWSVGQMVSWSDGQLVRWSVSLLARAHSLTVVIIF